MIAVDCPVPEWGVIHALLANTYPLQWSYQDQTAATDYGELSPGEDLEYQNFKGKIFFLASQGTQSWTNPHRATTGPAVTKNRVRVLPGTGVQNLAVKPGVQSQYV